MMMLVRAFIFLRIALECTTRTLITALFIILFSISAACFVFRIAYNLFIYRMYYKLYRRRQHIFLLLIVVLVVFVVLRKSSNKSDNAVQRKSNERINMQNYVPPAPCVGCPGENGQGVGLTVSRSKLIQ